MDNTLFDFLHCSLQFYPENILIYNKTPQDRFSHVFQVLFCLWEAELQHNFDKCEFYFPETIFLGLNVSKKSIQMHRQKETMIFNQSQPTFFYHLRPFLEFSNFHPHFIQDFSKLNYSVTCPTKKDTLIDWTLAFSSTFKNWKKMII